MHARTSSPAKCPRLAAPILLGCLIALQLAVLSRRQTTGHLRGISGTPAIAARPGISGISGATRWRAPSLQTVHHPSRGRRFQARASIPEKDKYLDEDRVSMRTKELEERKQHLLQELTDINKELEMKSSKPRTLPCDYGYLAKTAGRYFDLQDQPGPPSNALNMARDNFFREFDEMIRFFTIRLQALFTGRSPREVEEQEECIIDPNGDLDIQACIDYRRQLGNLTLSNDAVWARERNRPEIQTPIVIKIPYLILCYMLDFLFDGKPLERFWFLETVARMPYLSYVTMLHLYESFGWWRRAAAVKRVHFAEEWNEFHHLLIYESLGGDQSWLTRFLAQHAAIIYYWVLVTLWLLSPTLAYNFSELIEAHAVDTYGEFADANEELLKSLPAPAIALQYYMGGDMYLYDEFQTEREIGEERRPNITSLHDVICTIRDDEAEHVATMAACQKQGALVRSINTEKAILFFGATYYLTNQLLTSSIVRSTPELIRALPFLTPFSEQLTPLVARINELREALPEGWIEKLPEVIHDVLPALPDEAVDALVTLISRLPFLIDLF